LIITRRSSKKAFSVIPANPGSGSGAGAGIQVFRGSLDPAFAGVTALLSFAGASLVPRRLGISEVDHPTSAVLRGVAPAAAGLGPLVAVCLLFVPIRILDYPLFSAINVMHSRYTDPIWLGLTTLGDGLILGIILGAFLLLNPRITVLGILLLLLSGMMVHPIKWIVADLRPIAVLDSVHVIGPLLRSGSFPSGHAASVTAAGLAIVHYWPSRPAIATVLSLGALICLSRILVGAHFPSDILGGIILSLVLFRLVLLFAWPQLEPVIADAPSFSRTSFRWAFRVEMVVVIFVLMAYGPFLADSPLTAVVVAAGLLVVLGWERFSNNRAGKTCPGQADLPAKDTPSPL